MLYRSQVVVQDEITAQSAIDVVSQFHTKATVTLSGNVARLEVDLVILKATIISPAGAIWRKVTANPRTSTSDVYFKNFLYKSSSGKTLRAQENENQGLVNLIVRPTPNGGLHPPGNITITVVFALDDSNVHDTYQFASLGQWAKVA